MFKILSQHSIHDGVLCECVPFFDSLSGAIGERVVILPVENSRLFALAKNHPEKFHFYYTQLLQNIFHKIHVFKTFSKFI
jgi:hypothetical protein